MDIVRRQQHTVDNTVQYYVRSPGLDEAYRTLSWQQIWWVAHRHFFIGHTASTADEQSRPSNKTVFRLPFGKLKDLFLLPHFASNAQPLNIRNPPNLQRGRIHILLRGTSLECRLAFFEVASVPLRADQGEDDNVGGHGSDEDCLDEGVVWYIFWAFRSLDRCTCVFSAGYGTGG